MVVQCFIKLVQKLVPLHSDVNGALRLLIQGLLEFLNKLLISKCGILWASALAHQLLVLPQVLNLPLQLGQVRLVLFYFSSILLVLLPQHSHIILQAPQLALNASYLKAGVVGLLLPEIRLLGALLGVAQQLQGMEGLVLSDLVALASLIMQEALYSGESGLFSRDFGCYTALLGPLVASFQLNRAHIENNLSSAANLMTKITNPHWFLKTGFTISRHSFAHSCRQPSIRILVLKQIAVELVYLKYLRVLAVLGAGKRVQVGEQVVGSTAVHGRACLLLYQQFTISINLHDYWTNNLARLGRSFMWHQFRPVLVNLSRLVRCRKQFKLFSNYNQVYNAKFKNHQYLNLKMEASQRAPTPSSDPQNGAERCPSISEQSESGEEIGSENPHNNKGCNCKKSKCMKKYCECYFAGSRCSEACRCLDCENGTLYDSQGLPIQEEVGSQTRKANNQPRFCNCKKSQCQKKYCECFHAGVACTPGCRCQDCKNVGPVDTCEPALVAQTLPVSVAKGKNPQFVQKLDGLLQTVEEPHRQSLLEFIYYLLS